MILLNERNIKTAFLYWELNSWIFKLYKIKAHLFVYKLSIINKC
jgi:hypothetical protein